MSDDDNKTYVYVVSKTLREEASVPNRPRAWRVCGHMPVFAAFLLDRAQEYQRQRVLQELPGMDMQPLVSVSMLPTLVMGIVSDRREQPLVTNWRKHGYVMPKHLRVEQYTALAKLLEVHIYPITQVEAE